MARNRKNHMIHTIRVRTMKGPDLSGDSLFHEIKQVGKNGITKIRTAKVYRVEGLNEQQAKTLAEIAFCEEINQEYRINEPAFSGRETPKHVIEIAYKPGVMNPEVGSIIKSAKDLGLPLQAADSSHEYAFYGNVSPEHLTDLIKKLNLYNAITEHIVEKEPKTLKITGSVGPVAIIDIRSKNDEELMMLSRDKLFLNLEEMKVIQKYFQKIKRDPTDCEIEILAQTWSEHCVHKTFKADLTIDGKKKKPLIKRIMETARGHDNLIVSAFSDNSGVIDFFDGYGICGKVETHNSPSAIEPYGGAMTGSGGVFRDVLGTGQGAKVLISTDIFCFAPPTLSKKELPPGCLPPEYLLKRVVSGVRDYGNRVGIPTNNGSLHFHKDFRAKPTIAVGAYGIIQKSKAQKGQAKPGDLAITLGGRTGRDGIHGATFSSGEMTDRTMTVSGSAVQIGNAIEEKRVIDAIEELQKAGFIRAITDCGAGGYSSAIGEMGKDTGVKVFLEKVPLKYTGLSPWEIFLSESQERMVIAVAPTDQKKVLAICNRYNVEATLIGEFTKTKRLDVFYKKNLVCTLDMTFLHDGLPQRHMVGKTTLSDAARQKLKLPSNPKDYEAVWKHILSHGNVCSKEPIVRLYDHNVMGSNALHPFGGVDFDAPNDGTIVKPFLHKPYGIATTHGLNPVLMQLDPYQGSLWAITEAVANYVAVGGDLKYAAFIDNFIWPFPDEASLADLDKAVDACVKMSQLLLMPFVSGKDSLSSTYRYKDGKVLKIPPVLLISVFGKIADVTKTASSDLKKTDSVLALVGRPDTKNLGGTTYFDVTGAASNAIPRVDLTTLPKTLTTITKGVQDGTILSVHDISEGGIASALAEMCFGAGFGAVINLANISADRPDFIFFNETAGTFLVEVETMEKAQQLLKNVPHAIIGKTQRLPKIQVFAKKKCLTDSSLPSLKKAWQKPMKKYFA